MAAHIIHLITHRRVVIIISKIVLLIVMVNVYTRDWSLELTLAPNIALNYQLNRIHVSDNDGIEVTSTQCNPYS